MGEVIGADSCATSSIKDAQALMQGGSKPVQELYISTTPAPVVPMRTVLNRIR